MGIKQHRQSIWYIKNDLSKHNNRNRTYWWEKYLDKYDFDMDGRPLRDFATWYGRPGGKNDGKSFYIYGYKQAKIPVKKKK